MLRVPGDAPLPHSLLPPSAPSGAELGGSRLRDGGPWEGWGRGLWVVGTVCLREQVCPRVRDGAAGWSVPVATVDWFPGPLGSTTIGEKGGRWNGPGGET